MRSTVLDTPLLPISADSPCGSDLEYDTEFMVLWADAERAFANESHAVDLLDEAGWKALQHRASRLMRRTIDLRLIVLWCRAGLRWGDLESRLAELATALLVIADVCQRFGELFHPRLGMDDDGYEDGEARLHALLPFGASHVGIELVAMIPRGSRPASGKLEELCGVLAAALAATLPEGVAMPEAACERFRLAAASTSGIEGFQEHWSRIVVRLGTLQALFKACSKVTAPSRASDAAAKDEPPGVAEAADDSAVAQEAYLERLLTFLDETEPGRE